MLAICNGVGDVYDNTYICHMVKQTTFVHKQPEASKDYKLAYDIVNSLEVGASDTVIADNDKVFRKYIYDLGLKQNKEFATRRTGDNSRRVTRLS
jgi:hypothetical protein